MWKDTQCAVVSEDPQLHRNMILWAENNVEQRQYIKAINSYYLLTMREWVVFFKLIYIAYFLFFFF